MASTRPPLVETTFDVANWFIDRALNDNEYLQPQKLHRLMFLAQAYFAVANNGQRLMPAIFIADAVGPLEPNIYRAFETQKAWITQEKMPEKATLFLDNIWRRFGGHSAEHLSKVIRKHPPYAEAFAEHPRSVITEEAMVAFYGNIRVDGPAGQRTAGGVAHSADAPALETVLRPWVMRSHKGKPVNVMPWMPRKGPPRDDNQ